MIPPDYMVANMPTKDRCLRTFDELDRRCTGTLTNNDLGRLTRRLIPMLAHKATIDKAKRAADTGAGPLERGKIEAFVRFRVYYSNCWDMFTKDNLSHAHVLDRHEFGRIATAFGIEGGDIDEVFESMVLRETQAVFLPYHEFCGWMARTTCEWGLYHFTAKSHRAFVISTANATATESLSPLGIGDGKAIAVGSPAQQSWSSDTGYAVAQSGWSYCEEESVGYSDGDSMDRSNLTRPISLEAFKKGKRVKSGPRVGSSPGASGGTNDENVCEARDILSNGIGAGLGPGEQRQLDTSLPVMEDGQMNSSTTVKPNVGHDWFVLPSYATDGMLSRVEALQLFDNLDTNQKLTLSVDDLGEIIGRCFGRFVHKASTMRAFQAAAENGRSRRGGVLKRNEFEAFLRFALYYNNFWDMFTVNGRHVSKLSRDEFSKSAPPLGVADANVAFSSMGGTRSRWLTYYEFCTWMARNTCEWHLDDVDSRSDVSPKTIASERVAVMPSKEAALKLFDELDTNSSQSIRCGSLRKVWKQLFGNVSHSDTVIQAYIAADKDGGGVITRDEFEVFLRFAVCYNNYWSAFSKNDKHVSRLNRRDFAVFWSSISIEGSANEVFDSMDGERNDVSFDEFCTFLAGHSCEWDDGSATAIAASGTGALDSAGLVGDAADETASDQENALAGQSVPSDEKAGAVADGDALNGGILVGDGLQDGSSRDASTAIRAGVDGEGSGNVAFGQDEDHFASETNRSSAIRTVNQRSPLQDHGNRLLRERSSTNDIDKTRRDASLAAVATTEDKHLDGTTARDLPLELHAGEEKGSDEMESLGAIASANESARASDNDRGAAAEAPESEDAPLSPKKQEKISPFTPGSFDAMTLTQLAKVWKSLLPQKAAIIAAYDRANGDAAYVSSREELNAYLRFTRLYERVSEQQLTFLNRTEFKQAAGTLGILGDIGRAFDLIDERCDGSVSLEVICTWIARNSQDLGCLHSEDVSWETQNINIEVKGDEPLRASLTDLLPVTDGGNEMLQSEEGLTAEAEVSPKSVGSERVAVMPSKEVALKLFDELDTNSSQSLPCSSLHKIWKQLFGDVSHSDMVMQAYIAVNKDGDGVIARDEFEVFLRFAICYNNYWSSFSKHGKHVGRLHRRDFAVFWSSIDVEGSANEVFDSMDGERNDVSFDEFCAFLAERFCEWGDGSATAIGSGGALAIGQNTHHDGTTARDLSLELGAGEEKGPGELESLGAIATDDDIAAAAAVTAESEDDLHGTTARGLPLESEIREENGPGELKSLEDNTSARFTDNDITAGASAAGTAMSEDTLHGTTARGLPLVLDAGEEKGPGELESLGAIATDEDIAAATAATAKPELHGTPARGLPLELDMGEENGPGELKSLEDNTSARFTDNDIAAGAAAADTTESEDAPPGTTARGLPLVLDAGEEKGPGELGTFDEIESARSSDDESAAAALRSTESEDSQLTPKRQTKISPFTPGSFDAMTLTQLAKVWKSLLPRKAAVIEAYDRANKDAAYVLSRVELNAYLRFTRLYERLREQQLFMLNRDEFKQAAGTLGILGDIDRAFDLIDERGNGSVSLEVICTWIARNSKDLGSLHSDDVTWETLTINVEVGNGDEPLRASLTDLLPVTDAGYRSDEDDVAPTPESGVSPAKSVGSERVAVMPSKEEALKLFDELDTNSSQTLPCSSLRMIWKHLFGNVLRNATVIQAYIAADEDGDGVITRDEFEVFLRFTVYYNNCWSAFSKNGKHVSRLNRRDFAVFWSSIGIGGSANGVFDAMDGEGNEDGEVSFDEFCTFLARRTCEWDNSSVKEEVENGEADTIELGGGDTVSPVETGAMDGPRHGQVTADKAVSGVKASTKSVPPRKRETRKIVRRDYTKRAFIGGTSSSGSKFDLIDLPDFMLVSLPSKAEAMRLFSESDKDKNNVITFGEASKMAKQLFPKFSHKAPLKKAFDAADRDGNGIISWFEFEIFLRYSVYYNNSREQFLSAAERRASWKSLSKKSRMNRSNFRIVAPSFGVRSDMIDQVFDLMDENGGDSLSHHEFCKWISQNTCTWSSK